MASVGFCDQFPQSVSSPDSQTEHNDSKLIAFLNENFRDRAEHLDVWKSLILNDATAKECLLSALEKLEVLEKEKRPFLPDKRLILNALTYKPPSEIQAMIVGNDPVPEIELATGLAFSFPIRSQDDSAEKDALYKSMDLFLMRITNGCKGRAVAEMKLALQDAGIERIGDYNYCYEHWARRGVLLLNALLTIEAESPDLSNKHKFWLPFTERLILLILQETGSTPVLGMFWGWFAMQLHNSVKRRSSVQNGIDWNMSKLGLFESYYHPTSKCPREGLEFLPNASRQFQSKSELFEPCENETPLPPDVETFYEE